MIYPWKNAYSMMVYPTQLSWQLNCSCQDCFSTIWPPGSRNSAWRAHRATCWLCGEQQFCSASVTTLQACLSDSPGLYHIICLWHFPFSLSLSSFCLSLSDNSNVCLSVCIRSVSLILFCPCTSFLVFYHWNVLGPPAVS